MDLQPHSWFHPLGMFNMLIGVYIQYVVLVSKWYLITSNVQYLVVVSKYLVIFS